MSPYTVLRISPDATPEEIEEAYCRMRRLISSGIPEKQIQNAYATLKDPIRKAIADMQLGGANSAQVTRDRGASWLKRLLRK